VRFSGGIAAALLASVLSTTAASAGDFASFQPIGFSADGSVFAFEEYGVQDGSGFPYSKIFFIDTRKDTFLAGTPIRLRIDEENTSLAKVRAQTSEKAAPLVRKFDLAANPGLLAAFNPITETESSPHRLTYRQYAVDPPVGGDFTLTLDEIHLAPSALCKDVTPQSAGFRLAFQTEDGTASDRVLHADTAIPDSRKCPTGYRIGGVMVYNPLQGEPVHVVLVQVLSVGFEGSDGRWIAVPEPAAP
jgi:predicted secreted protein